MCHGSGKNLVAVASLSEFANQITRAIAELLQTKHLYQSVKVPQAERKLFTPRETAAIEGVWYADGPSARARMVQSDEADYLLFSPPDVRLFCTGCDAVEPFTLVSVVDFIHQQDRWYRSESKNSENTQVFVLSYRCQGCKQVPEIFLVRRDQHRLTLCGRAPIENVNVPDVIPKAVKQFYRGAVVAHQSGETLAGNFSCFAR